MYIVKWFNNLLDYNFADTKQPQRTKNYVFQPKDVNIM